MNSCGSHIRDLSPCKRDQFHRLHRALSSVTQKHPIDRKMNVSFSHRCCTKTSWSDPRAPPNPGPVCHPPSLTDPLYVARSRSVVSSAEATRTRVQKSVAAVRTETETGRSQREIKAKTSGNLLGQRQIWVIARLQSLDRCHNLRFVSFEFRPARER